METIVDSSQLVPPGHCPFGPQHLQVAGRRFGNGEAFASMVPFHHQPDQNWSYPWCKPWIILLARQAVSWTTQSSRTSLPSPMEFVKEHIAQASRCWQPSKKRNVLECCLTRILSYSVMVSDVSQAENHILIEDVVPTQLIDGKTMDLRSPR